MSQLIKNLQHKNLFDHPVKDIKLIETHISWVILTGHFAYKIKKPLNMGFLDYTDLAQRRRYCDEEVRLNQLLAPDIYLDVVAITGSEDHPQLNGKGEPIEYAVKMREFAQENLLTELAANHQITPTMARQIADDLASFHQKTKPAPADSRFGSSEEVAKPVFQNFEQIRELLPADQQRLPTLEKIETWSLTKLKQLAPVFDQRKAQGFVRECHGDVHLGNIVLLNNRPAIFDCIEFNDDFRTTDTMADLGFLTMDLHDKGLPELANIILNRYLHRTGDYEGLQVLRFYEVYRAVVRAKINLFQLQQVEANSALATQLRQNYDRCIKLAIQLSQPKQTWLMLTYGVTCSGKSSISKKIAKHFGAIRVRSDIERKRLFGYHMEAKTAAEQIQTLYNPEATQRVYQRLLQLCQISLAAGYAVIADATFLKQSFRQPFITLANQLHTPSIILHTYASSDILKEWIVKRLAAHPNEPSEATVAVLEQQLAQIEKLDESEAKRTLRINTETISANNVNRIFSDFSQLLSSATQEDSVKQP